MNDHYFMKMALTLAEKGRRLTSPNPMVGAVVAKDGIAVGKGYHESAGKPHAEVNAIADAGVSAKGATLYVTLEPCNHIGRTPPCTDTILSAGIKRAVVAMRDPNPDVQGGGVERLKDGGVEVSLGVCEPEAQRLNEAFVKYVKTKRPFVIAKCAATLDGQIATRTGDSKWVSGPESRRFGHWLRHAADAIMVGIGTVKTDDPSLTMRLEDVESPDPVRIILDTHLSIPETAKVLRVKSDSGIIIVSSLHAAEDKRARLEALGAQVMGSPVKAGRIDLDPLMDRLGGMGITSLLIEGGGQVLASALAAKIVDKISFFYAPKILGGNDGVPICRGVGPKQMSQSIAVENITVRRFADDVLIEGYIRY